MYCSTIRDPYSSFQAQTRSTKASRPSSWRVLPSARSSFSTTAWVAMPAWSVPRIQSVLRPRMRFMRTSASCIEPFRAWPMWRAPVTFGGGIATEKFAAGAPVASGWK